MANCTNCSGTGKLPCPHGYRVSHENGTQQGVVVWCHAWEVCGTCGGSGEVGVSPAPNT